MVMGDSVLGTVLLGLGLVTEMDGGCGWTLGLWSVDGGAQYRRKRRAGVGP